MNPFPPRPTGCPASGSVWLSSALASVLLGGSPVHADLDEVDIHGFVSQGYLSSTDNNFLAQTERGSAEFSEIGMSFSTELAGDLRAGLQLFARDLGDVGNHEIELDWAYFDYAWRPEIGFRAGRVKQPRGLYNETFDVDAVRSNIIMPPAVYSTLLRDVFMSVNGGGLYGNIPIGEAGDLDYQVYAGTGNVGNDGSVAKSINSFGLFTQRFFDVRHILAGGVVWNTSLTGLRLGGTSSEASWKSTGDTKPAFVEMGLPPTSSVESDDYHTWVASAEYTTDRFTLVGEYSIQTADLVVSAPVAPPVINSEGWYVQTAWRFNEWLEVGGYRNVSFADRDDRDGKSYTPSFGAWQHSWTASARFDISTNLIFKVEHHWIDGVKDLVATDTPGGTVEDWTLLAVKSSLAF